MQDIQLPSGERVREVFAGYSTKADLDAAMDKRRAELEEQGGKLIERRKIGRNEPCPCGSGAKFKRCCLRKFEDAGQGKYVRVA